MDLPIRIASMGLANHGKSTLLGYIAFRYLDKFESENYQQFINRLDSEGNYKPDRFFSLIFDRKKIEIEGTPESDKDTKGTSKVTSHLRVSISKKQFWLVDSPGHSKYYKNAIPGIYQAWAIIYVISSSDISKIVDVIESNSPDSILTLYPVIVRTYGIRHVTIAISKMDRLEFSDKPYLKAIETILPWFSEKSGLSIDKIKVIPLSIDVKSKDDINVFNKPRETMRWYKGPTLIEWINNITPPKPSNLPLFIPVESVYIKKIKGTSLVVTGHLIGGCIATNQKVKIVPLALSDESKIPRFIIGKVIKLRRRDKSDLIKWQVIDNSESDQNEFQEGQIISLQLNLIDDFKLLDSNKSAFKRGCIIASEDQKVSIGSILVAEVIVPENEPPIRLYQAWHIYLYGKSRGDAYVIDCETTIDERNISETNKLKVSIQKITFAVRFPVAYPEINNKLCDIFRGLIISNGSSFLSGRVNEIGTIQKYEALCNYSLSKQMLIKLQKKLNRDNFKRISFINNGDNFSFFIKQPYYDDYFEAAKLVRYYVPSLVRDVKPIIQYSIKYD